MATGATGRVPAGRRVDFYPAARHSRARRVAPHHRRAGASSPIRSASHQHQGNFVTFQQRSLADSAHYGSLTSAELRGGALGERREIGTINLGGSATYAGARSTRISICPKTTACGT